MSLFHISHKEHCNTRRLCFYVSTTQSLEKDIKRNKTSLELPKSFVLLVSFCSLSLVCCFCDSPRLKGFPERSIKTSFVIPCLIFVLCSGSSYIFVLFYIFLFLFFVFFPFSLPRHETFPMAVFCVFIPLFLFICIQKKGHE